MQSLEQQIRERAYHLWLSHGSEGAADQHWLAAEREVLEAFAAPVGEAPPVKTAPRKRASAKAKKAA